MLFFIFVSLLLSVAVMVLMLRTLMRKSAASPTPDNDASLLYKQRKQELETELGKQAITQKQYDELLENYQKELYLAHKPQQQQTADYRLLSNKALNISIVLLMPLTAALIYIVIGGGTAAMHWRIPTMTDLEQNTEQLLAALDEKLTAQGGSAEEWHFLAQGYRNQQQYEAAKIAFNKALTMQPDAPLLLADYIELLMLMNDNQPTEESSALLQQALSGHPKHPKLLWVAAIDASYKNDTDLQIDYLQQLAEQMPVDAAERKTVEKIIAETAAQQERSPAAKAIQVSIQIADELQSLITDKSVLYVFARAPSGPRMPLAVARFAGNQIPERVTLSDDMAMMPDMKLSNFATVNLHALISHSGQAQAAPGDLRGIVEDVSTDHDAVVSITINEVITE